MARATSATKARRALLSVWLGFFLFNLILVFSFYLAEWVEGDTLKEALKQLNAGYSPYLGAILIYYWSSASPTASVRSGLSLQLALACSALWNVLLTLFLVLLPMEEALENIRDIGGGFSWLVAGAIGYYFAKPQA
jgi:hypothetical protein